MDINKIVMKSIDDTVNKMINKDISIDLPEPPEDMKDNIKFIELLMTYSNVLLENYNTELSKNLSSQGIQI